MSELMGCKKKEKQTISSRLSVVSISKRKASLKPIPVAFSIKAKFPPVYLQRYGNCTTCAALACDDYYYHGSGVFVPSATYTYYNQLAYAHSLNEDAGSDVETALLMIKKDGVCNSKIWANDEPFNRKPSPEAYEDGLHGHEIKKKYLVKNLKQLKQAIASGFPVVGGFAWPFKGYDENFILFTPTRKEVKRAQSGHAVVVVGYNDAEQAVEIRNSWGRSWGNDGHAFMTYEAVNLCAWWDDMYAITK